MADLEKYKEFETDLYRVTDTIGVPHPYMIGARHVGWAADHHCGLLGEAAIEDAEKHGIHCATQGCRLSYKEHETALLIGTKFHGQLKDAPGLNEYLLSIKPLCEADHYVGFAFIKED